MAYSSGPYGPGGYSPPGGPPPLDDPWGPPHGFQGPGAFPPPPPPRRSNTGLIVGLVIAVVVAVPFCGGVATYAIGARAAKHTPTEPAEPLPSGPAPVPVGYRLVEAGAYSYAVPQAWEELDAASLGSPDISHAQRAPIPAGNFATNVNVASHAFGGDGPAFAATNLIELRKVATIRHQGPATSGPRAAWDIEAEWPSAGTIPYVTWQRYLGNGTTGYILTCSSGASVFESQRPICEAILSSFRVE
jgi:hypothetical protein